MTTQHIKVTALVPLYYCDSSIYNTISDFFHSLMDNYPEIDIIVSDDASPLEHDLPVTIRNKKNLGYTRNINKLLKYWRESADLGDICIVMNDDLLIKKGDLDNYFKIKGEGIFFPSDSSSANDGRFGCIFGLNAKTLDKLGYLDERFINYWSDYDYYMRAKELKIPIVCWYDKVVTHRESTTYSKLDKNSLLEADTNTFKSIH